MKFLIHLIHFQFWLSCILDLSQLIEVITITPELTKAERKLLKDLLKESKKFPDGCIPINRQEESEQKYYLHHFWNEKLIWDATMPDTPENQNGMPTYNAIKLSPDGLHYFEKYHEYKPRAVLKWNRLAYHCCYNNFFNSKHAKLVTMADKTAEMILENRGCFSMKKANP